VVVVEDMDLSDGCIIAHRNTFISLFIRIPEGSGKACKYSKSVVTPVYIYNSGSERRRVLRQETTDSGCEHNGSAD